MLTRFISPVLLALVLAGPSTARTEEGRHLFVAKLLLKRLAEVDLTSGPTKAFNKLSGDLRKLIDKKRADVGITKETIKKRDEVYSELKKTDLKADALWNTLQQKGGFTHAQRDVFRETPEIYKKFKFDALKLLTKEQRAQLSKPKKRKKS